MYWNRFDIALAYWVFSVLHHSGQGSAEYALQGPLSRLSFSPGRMFSESAFLADLGGEYTNAFEIYTRLADGSRKIRDRR